MPIILKLICTIATRFASLLTPIDERSEVTQVPIFSPMIIGIAIPKVIEPVSESACSTPTEAAEDWIIPVNTAPISTPMIGLLKAVSTLVNSGILARGDIESDISPIPCIRRAKPIRIVPIFFFF